MINEETLTGKWNEIQGQLRERWSQLSEDELSEFQGNTQQLVGMIQQRTGEARAKIETFIDELTQDSSLKKAADTVKDYAQQVAGTASQAAANVGETIREGAKAASDTAHAGYVQTERLVRNRPGQSLAVCFGAGMVAGLCMGLVLRSK